MTALLTETFLDSSHNFLMFPVQQVALSNSSGAMAGIYTIAMLTQNRDRDMQEMQP